MDFYFFYKFPIFLVCVLYLTHLYTKDFSSPYQKPIVGDSKAYYAYLPAILIYQDSQYGFIDDYEQKYYANNQRKDFLNFSARNEQKTSHARVSSVHCKQSSNYEIFSRKIHFLQFSPKV